LPEETSVESPTWDSLLGSSLLARRTMDKMRVETMLTPLKMMEVMGTVRRVSRNALMVAVCTSTGIVNHVTRYSIYGHHVTLLIRRGTVRRVSRNALMAAVCTSTGTVNHVTRNSIYGHHVTLLIRRVTVRRAAVFTSTGTARQRIITN